MFDAYCPKLWRDILFFVFRYSLYWGSYVYEINYSLWCQAAWSLYVFKFAFYDTTLYLGSYVYIYFFLICFSSIGIPVLTIIQILNYYAEQCIRHFHLFYSAYLELHLLGSLKLILFLRLVIVCATCFAVMNFS